jgi:hypothetical protein
LKLIQANAVLTELIKDNLLEKYSLTEKIIEVSEKIRKLENPHTNIPQSQSTLNLQQGGNQNINITSSLTGQFQR